MRMVTSSRARRLLFARSITVTYGHAVSKGWVAGKRTNERESERSEGCQEVSRGGAGWGKENYNRAMHIGKAAAHRRERSSPGKLLCFFSANISLSAFSSRNALYGCALLRALLMMQESSCRFFDFGSRICITANPGGLYIPARQKFSFVLDTLYICEILRFRRLSVLFCSPLSLARPLSVFLPRWK